MVEQRAGREKGREEERIKSTESCLISLLKHKNQKLFFFLDVHPF